MKPRMFFTFLRANETATILSLIRGKKPILRRNNMIIYLKQKAVKTFMQVI